MVSDIYRNVRSQGGKLSLLLTVVFVSAFSANLFAQQSGDKPSVVRPGAPGKETKTLSPDTRARLPLVTKKDVEFMQGMIHHHAQAVEMTALIAERTKHEGIIGLGNRISQSQADEIEFMKRWLTTRGQKTTMEMPKMDHKKGMHDHKKMMMMPGMLTEKQMAALRDSKGSEFDRLFLEGMIQHHIGALVMVEDLFGSAGAGQDAEIFTFATDVDSTQRAEIKIMRSMLREE